MRPLVLAVLLPSLSAQAALGPTSPPPGIESSTWEAMWKRADWASKKAARLVKGSNPDCLRAVFLRMLGGIEAAASGQDGLPTVLAKGYKTAFLRALESNRDDECRNDDGRGNGADVEAAARFATETTEWDKRPMRSELLDAVRYFAGLGVALDSAILAPAGGVLIIVNPERLPDVRPPAVRKTRPDDVL